MQLPLFSFEEAESPKQQLAANITNIQNTSNGAKIFFRVYGNSSKEAVQLYYTTTSDSQMRGASTPPVEVVADGITTYKMEWDIRLDGVVSSDRVNLMIDVV